MIDISTIKLVIWDLDETFWKGTISEGDVFTPKEHIELLRDLTDCGIINSICSKNDFEPTKKRLEQLGVWGLFVFPSISWEGKGAQIKDKIDKVALRPVNTLFLDDNPSNLGEAKHFLPEIQIGGPDLIPELIRQVKLAEKKDVQHKRLKQYKILEAKDVASKSFSSNEDFLFDSCIRVSILNDCANQLSRIHELILRSNQLNFTKKRIDIDTLKAILNDPAYSCGYVTAEDRFGDYGIIGFYALTQGKLEHFLFSCRTMGQSIEQWVYAQLGFPELEVVGEVRTQLNKTACPAWINHSFADIPIETPVYGDSLSGRFLLKGPCDLSHSQVYLKDAAHFDTEFTYVSDASGKIIDAHNHSVHIEGLHEYTNSQNDELLNDCVFMDPSMFSGGFFTQSYDVIFLSTLIESSYCIYQKRNSNLRVVFGSVDLTNPCNWEGYCRGDYYAGGNKFSIEYLESFSSKFEYVGKTTPEMYLTFLKKCMNWLPAKTHICLILGPTQVYEGDDDAKNQHSHLNSAIKNYSKEQPRVSYIEIDDCVKDQSDFDGALTHFSARVYYEIAQRMIRVINQITGEKITSYSSAIITIDSIILKMRSFLKKILPKDSRMYSSLKRVYNNIYKQRNR